MNATHHGRCHLLRPPSPPTIVTHRQFYSFIFFCLPNNTNFDPFHSHMVTQQYHRMIIIHFIPLSIPIKGWPRPFFLPLQLLGLTIIIQIICKDGSPLINIFKKFG
ncbi:hypothetical protein Hanom_Chr04g00382891 [Helianthus anomalus]